MGEDSGLGLRFGATGASRSAVGTASTNAALDDATAALVALISGSTTAIERKTDNGNEPDIENKTELEHETVEDYWEEEEEELPVISIELERLVGYKPATTDEIESIKKQLIEAMWMRYKSSNNSNSNNNSEKTAETKDDSESEPESRDNNPHEETSDENVPPPDFDDQIKELLDSRVARFGSIDCGALENGAAAGVATDTDEKPHNQNNPSPFLEIAYPSRIILPSNNSTTTSNQILDDTARIWSDIRSLSYELDENETDEEADENEIEIETGETPTAFLYHLADHLEHTGRMLSWKHAMALELKDILFRESLHKNHELWVKEQRTAKLEQLYPIRETLVHRKEVAKLDFDKWVAIKETAIRKDLLLYDHNEKRKKRLGNDADAGGGTESMLGGGELSFPEQFELMGLLPKDSQLYEEEDWGGTLDDDDDFDYYNSDYSDCSDDDDDNDGDGDDSGDDSGYDDDKEGDDGGGGDDHEQTDPLPPIVAIGNSETPSTATTTTTDMIMMNPGTGAIQSNTALDGIAGTATASTAAVPKPFLRRNKARRKKKARVQKKKELAEAKRLEERQNRKTHEAFLEAKHTTNELVLAQTLLVALEKKINDVDELLESLQEEEWAAAEDAEDKLENPDQSLPQNQKDGKMSLLDQILAMILGALPAAPGSKDRERHFRYVKDEHEFIAHGWKAYFGRLPTTFVPGAALDSDGSPIGNTDEEHPEPESSENRPPTTKARKGFAAPPPAISMELSKITSSRKATVNANSAAATTVVTATTTTTTTTPQEQRMALGIVDNENDDWDTLADNDE